MTVYVLWENHATGSIRDFGPHAFLVACVADRLGTNRFELQRQEVINGRSCNGNSNVFRELGRQPLWNAAPYLIATLDADKLHDLLGGTARKSVDQTGYAAWAAQMEAQCRARIGAHDAARLTVAFLDRNVESLLQVLGGDTIEKDVVHRDTILRRASASPDLIHRASAQMPTWAALVDAVARRL